MAGLVIADTREQVTRLNAAIRDHRLTISAASDGRVVTTAAGEQLGVGDRIATRRNDRDVGVANRDRWTITRVPADGGLHVLGPTGHRALPAGYVHQHVELAYATTAHGAQGETVHTAHLVVGESTGAAAAYVGMTRGRQRNIAHLVADTLTRPRSNGCRSSDVAAPTSARATPPAKQPATSNATGHSGHWPLTAVLQRLRAGWDTEHDLSRALRATTARRDLYAAHGHAAADRVAEIDTDLDALQARLTQVRHQIRATLREPALQALPADRLTAEHRTWRDQRDAAVQAARLRQQQQQPAHRRREIPAPSSAAGPTVAPGSDSDAALGTPRAPEQRQHASAGQNTRKSRLRSCPRPPRPSAYTAHELRPEKEAP